MAGVDELEPYMTEAQIKMAIHRVGWNMRYRKSAEERK
jgi:hypothetical protein